MLDSYQREVAHFEDRAALVLAGPGSGKTTCIMERISFLVEERGVKPEQILVITFTKDAAMEMQQRFVRRVGARRKVSFGTFHSVFYHILMEHPSYRGYGILYGKPRMEMLHRIVTGMGLDAGKQGFLEDLERDLAKLAAVGGPREGENIQEAGVDFQPVSMDRAELATLWHRYGDAKSKCRKLDFDDMLTKTLQLFETDTGFRKKWQHRFTYVLIDEAQDMNEVQFDLMKILCERGNIMAVGDDDQSIYGFRGANPKVLKLFETYFHAKVLHLVYNYRSMTQIVSSSVEVISKNTMRYPKELKAVQEGAGEVHYENFATDREEAKRVVQLCRDADAKGYTLGVLFRNHQEALPVIYALLEAQIPFFTKEPYGMPFSDVISNQLRNLLEVYVTYKRDRDVCKVDDSFWGTLFDGKEQREGAFQLLQSFSPYAIINYIRKGLGFDVYIRSIAENAVKLQEYMERADVFQEQMRGKKTVEEALQSIQDIVEFQMKKIPKEPGESMVRFYTFHGSKGLEFQRVILLNVNEGITPSKRATSEEEMEEERRMFYVAMTRARDVIDFFSIQRRRNEILYPSKYLQDITCLQSDPESRQNVSPQLHTRRQTECCPSMEHHFHLQNNDR